MKPTHLLALAVALPALALPLAGARSAYLGVVQEQYHLTDDPALDKAGCRYCHVNAFGGAPWNKFGQAIKVAYDGEAKRNIGQALSIVMKAARDSDGDGFTDPLEVVAKTLPGDAKSKPAKTKAALTAEYKKLGGADYFKPVQ